MMQQPQVQPAIMHPMIDTRQPPRFFDGGLSWPELHRLADLWHAKRHGRPMPARSDFDPLELKPWLGWLALVRVVDDGTDFVFTIYGTNMSWASGQELQGKSIDALPPTTRLPVVESYRLACRLRRPLFSALILRDELRQRRVLERVILPLSCDGSTVDRLLIGIGRHDIEDDEVADYRHSLLGCDVTITIVDP